MKKPRKYATGGLAAGLTSGLGVGMAARRAFDKDDGTAGVTAKKKQAGEVPVIDEPAAAYRRGGKVRRK